jgi:hypothetical protein
MAARVPYWSHAVKVLIPTAACHAAANRAADTPPPSLAPHCSACRRPGRARTQDHARAERRLQQRHGRREQLARVRGLRAAPQRPDDRQRGRHGQPGSLVGRARPQKFALEALPARAPAASHIGARPAGAVPAMMGAS